VSNDEQVEELSLSNRDMKRLPKNCLPNILYLYRKDLSSYEAPEVELFNEADSPSSEWKVKLAQNPSSEWRNIKLLSEEDCLAVAQTVVFTKLNF
jgi:hypothetical protein